MIGLESSNIHSILAQKKLHKLLEENSTRLTTDHWNLLPCNAEMFLYASPSLFFFWHMLTVTTGSWQWNCLIYYHCSYIVLHSVLLALKTPLHSKRLPQPNYAKNAYITFSWFSPSQRENTSGHQTSVEFSLGSKV